MTHEHPEDESANGGFDIESLVDETKARTTISRERGSTGLRKAGGFIQEEYLPALQGERGRRILREMGTNDPVCSGVLHTFEMLLRGARLTVRPAELNSPDADQDAEQFDVNVMGETFPGTTQRGTETKDAKAVAAFVEECFDDMSHSFSDFISQVASQFQYGWAIHEIVYKRREGDNPRSPGKGSRFNDGLIGWRKFAPRAQDTLWKWEFDRHGGLDAFWQMDPYRNIDTLPGNNPSSALRMPIEKMLLFTTTQQAASPEGKSILRAAYRPWYFKKRIEEIEAIGVERDLAGMPVIYAPSEIFGDNASDADKELLVILQEAVQNIRRDQQDGLVFPIEYDENGNLLYKFELASTGGSRQLDTNLILQRKSTEMAMSVLADFMIIGNSESGASSFALSQDKTNLFAMAVDAYLKSIAEVLMRHAIPRLLRMNGIDTALAPVLTFEAVRAPTLEELGEFVQRLSRAGAPFFPDERLQNYLYERAGMPPPSPSVDPLAEGGDPNAPQPVDGGVNDGSLLPEGDGSFEDTGTGEPIDTLAPDATADPTSNNDTASRNRGKSKTARPGTPTGTSTEFFDD